MRDRSYKCPLTDNIIYKGIHRTNCLLVILGPGLSNVYIAAIIFIVFLSSAAAGPAVHYLSEIPFGSANTSIIADMVYTYMCSRVFSFFFFFFVCIMTFITRVLYKKKKIINTSISDEQHFENHPRRVPLVVRTPPVVATLRPMATRERAGNDTPSSTGCLNAVAGTCLTTGSS